MRQECPPGRICALLRSARIRHLWLSNAYGKEGRELSTQAGIAGLIRSELPEERPPVGAKSHPLICSRGACSRYYAVTSGAAS
jgi:hypothetical protein